MGVRSTPRQGKSALCLGKELGHIWPNPGFTRNRVIFHVLPLLLPWEIGKAHFLRLLPKLPTLELRVFFGFLCVMYFLYIKGSD